MKKTMADYRAELVELILNDEDLNLSEQSAFSDVARMSDKTVFDLLNIEPDETAQAQAQENAAFEKEKAERQAVKNQHHERLSQLSGGARIAAILELEQQGGTGSLLPASEQSRLTSGELTGADRIAAALTVQSNA